MTSDFLQALFLVQWRTTNKALPANHSCPGPTQLLCSMTGLSFSFLSQAPSWCSWVYPVFSCIWGFYLRACLVMSSRTFIRVSQPSPSFFLADNCVVLLPRYSNMLIFSYGTTYLFVTLFLLRLIQNFICDLTFWFVKFFSCKVLDFWTKTL